MSALERIVTNSSVGSAIRGAVGELWSAGDPESDHLMRELVDAGVDIEEFGRLLERRRRRRVRVRV